MQAAHEVPFSLDWLASTFDVGLPRRASVVARGQTSPFGIMRVETSAGVFSVKRLAQAPRQVALRIESAAYKAGFPMPRPISTADGGLVATCSSEGIPIWVRTYTWVDGDAYDWDTVDPAVSATVGGLLAAMHALPVSQADLQEEPWSPLGGSGWQQLATQAGLRRLSWAPTLQDKLPALARWEEHVLACTTSDEPSVPSQRDLHPPNIIRSKANSQAGRHVVVDWDAAGPVIAREDVAMFALVWAGQPPDQAAVQAFIRGYRAAGGVYHSRGILDLTQRIRGLLAWIAYNVRRDLGEQPGPDPWLTPALLAGVHPFDLEELQHTAALFDQYSV
ncbi:MAG: phosphotransferase [Chloroflexi bacterium]|nr:phosphotransferase [Chloroflexota bacterium]